MDIVLHIGDLGNGGETGCDLLQRLLVSEAHLVPQMQSGGPRTVFRSRIDREESFDRHAAHLTEHSIESLDTRTGRSRAGYTLFEPADCVRMEFDKQLPRRRTAGTVNNLRIPTDVFAAGRRFIDVILCAADACSGKKHC